MSFEDSVPMAGWEGLYTIDREGNVYSLHHKHRGKLIGRHGEYTVQLTRRRGERPTVSVRKLYLATFGEEYPEPAKVYMPSRKSQFSGEGYPPLPPISDEERIENPYRVLWVSTGLFGQVIGKRGHLLWVMLDSGQLALFSPTALAEVPCPGWERIYKFRNTSGFSERKRDGNRSTVVTARYQAQEKGNSGEAQTTGDV